VQKHIKYQQIWYYACAHVQVYMRLCERNIVVEFSFFKTRT